MSDQHSRPVRVSGKIKRPKIAIVLITGANDGGGGTGRRFARIFQHFQHVQQTESGVNVWLITTPGFIEVMNRSSIAIDPDLNVIEISGDIGSTGGTPLDKVTSYRDYSANLQALLEQEQFDLAHIPLPHLSYAAFMVRDGGNLRQVFSMTATVGSFESMNWKAQLLYKIGYISSEAIDTLYTDVADRFPAFRDKFQVSPCSFTDYSRFRPAQEKRNYIVFAGRLEAYKNPYLFVDAVALCAERLRHDGWKCYLYGKGEFEQGIAARVDELNLGDLIELGATADLSPLLGESKVFVSIQQTENYPSQVLLEAMAAENAIVATDVGETRRLVDEEVGTLFAEQTPERLADAIEELIQDSDLCRTRGRKARERVVGSHNVASYSKYMEQLWLGVVERHPTHIHTSSASIARLILGSLVGELLRRVTGR